MKAWVPGSIRSQSAHASSASCLHGVLLCGDLSHRPDLVIAVPVCNERDRIETCINALADTLSQGTLAGVVLLVNNSTDKTVEKAILALGRRRMRGVVLDVTLAPAVATAGWARRLALDVAARWTRPGGVIMTTDADGRVAADWAETNLALLSEGAHLVCGRITADATEASALPPSIARSTALEAVYTALSIELDALLDPRPHDPWPHHGLASGASLAFRRRDYLAVGRMQPLPCSEDRAFAALFERHDLCVSHSNAPVVTVSCRLQGRANGGMADAISARIADPDSFADQRLLPASTTARRAMFRAALRATWSAKSGIGQIMGQLGVSDAHARRARSATTFGALWADVEAGVSCLTAPRMRPSDLARELPTLRRLVRQERSLK